MKRLTVITLAVLATLVACDYTVTATLEMPWCPVSDSAKAAADSVPVLCLVSQDSLP